MLTCAIESLTAALTAGEIQPMLPDHWEELGIHKSVMPLDPDFPAYMRADGLGQIVFAALRVNGGALVGYFINFISPHLHYKSTLTAKMDLIWIVPEHRGGGGKLLCDAMKRELTRRGVRLWWVGSKNHHPIEGFWKSEGFTPQESHWTLWLGDEADA